jgi:hypothetical protein
VSADSQNIYVADTGNNRIQKIDRQTFDPILQISSELGLNQPASVTLVGDQANETIYIADTGNNRVLMATIPRTDPLPAWNAVKQNLINGNINAALTQFSAVTVDSYHLLFNAMGSARLNQSMSAIGELTLISMDDDEARYYFSSTIKGQQFMFIVTFVKENGQWRLRAF